MSDYPEWMRKAASKGGSAKSDRKTKAARKNAKKGGWPKGRPRKPNAERKKVAAVGRNARARSAKNLTTELSNWTPQPALPNRNEKPYENRPNTRIPSRAYIIEHHGVRPLRGEQLAAVRVFLHMGDDLHAGLRCAEVEAADTGEK